MIKEIYYTYLGSNGTITSPVLLPDMHHVKKVKLIADKNKMLTNKDGVLLKTVMTTEEEISNWTEIDVDNNN